ncbi:MAG: EAL domain-containing protein [Gallionella sp.]|nr:EAL domain-containing protein [Gallionella sp.]
MHSRFVKRLIGNFLPAALIIIALGSVFYAFESNDDLKALIAHEKDHVHAGVESVNRTLLTLKNDTQYLAHSTPLTEAIELPDRVRIGRLAQDLNAFIGAKKAYHKVRWIDEKGRELARAESGGQAAVDTSSLAGNKSSRYYFDEAMRLKRNEIYLSPIDLEIEDDAIVQPPRPTLRAAARLFDAKGDARGIAVISYSARDLFDHIDQVSATENSSWMLLNEQGYWLKSSDPAQEFGFMLPHRASMASLQPDVWQKIDKAPSGHFFDAEGGLWMFDTVYPRRTIASDGANDDANTGRMKMVKHIDAAALGIHHHLLRKQTMLLVFFVLALAFAISFRLSRSQLDKDDSDIDLQHLLGELNQQKFALDQHAIVAIAGLDGTISYVNDKFCAISQYRREELIGQNHRIVKSGLHDATFYREMSDAIRNHIVWHGETCHRAKDGSLYWVKNTFVPLSSSSSYIAISTDITAQKQTEEKLRIASIAFETHEAIVVTDTQARIINVNHAFEQLTGYSTAEAIGQNPNILQSGRHDRQFYQEMWATLLAKGIWSGEMWDKRKDGTIYPKWLTISAVRNDQQEVTHYVAIFMDISERKRAEEEIQRLAFYDTLTELPNRRLLMDRLIQSLIASERNGSFGALLFMDMDNFKILNDTQGHDIGDMLLIEVARRLRVSVRETDTVARLGGDEFVVILQGLGSSELLAANQAEDIAEKIVATLSETYFLGKHEHHSSVSIGVGLFHGRGTTVDELLKRADTAMYQAKSAGRNAVRFFETDMQRAVESRAMMEKALRQALAKNELQLYYQMQVDREQRIVGAEALLRWINEERGFVSPAQFIPLAEESGLILPIGLWVLETACRQLQKWQDSTATRHLQLAVNVSARQFRQPNFVAQIGELLKTYGIDPTRLKLELTESIVLNDVEETVQKMLALKQFGVQFSMDDFGTGYSSLSYLKQLPLNQIKIDQSFVRDIVIDKSDAIIVKTIIDMSLNFNLEVIAEGVETEEQLEILRQNGCQAFQGYLFSKAVPLAEFESQIGRPKMILSNHMDASIGAGI